MFVYSLSKSRCELGVPMKIALAYRFQKLLCFYQ